MRSADAAPVYQLEILAQAFVLIVLNDDQSFGIVADGPAMRIQAIGTTNSIHVAMRPHLKAADIGRFAIHSPHGEGAVALACYQQIRSKERRVGKGCVSTCRSLWAPSH